MTPSTAARVLLAGVVCLLGGCADGTPPADGPVTRPASASPSADLVVPGTGRGSALTGTVLAGVEPGCLLLEAAGVVHQLVGATQGLAPGQRVTVRGRPDPAALTTCQQGTPFVVTAWSPA